MIYKKDDKYITSPFNGIKQTMIVKLINRLITHGNVNHKKTNGAFAIVSYFRCRGASVNYRACFVYK